MIALITPSKYVVEWRFNKENVLQIWYKCLHLDELRHAIIMLVQANTPYNGLNPSDINTLLL
jgi:hypothetical protein